MVGFVLPVVLSSVCQPAHSELLVLPIADESWNESYDELRPVSADLYAGAVLGTANKYVDPAKLFVHLPETKNPRLCVKISSRDARYYAESEYDVSGLSEGVYRIQFPTIHRGQLVKYLAIEISVLAMLKDNCENPDFTSVIPVSWEVAKDTSQFTIQLKAGDTQTIDSCINNVLYSG
jgi:hypothetical protein